MKTGLRFPAMLLFAIGVSMLLHSCNSERRRDIGYSDLILGYASPVRLPVVSPVSINLKDYVLDVERIDSVTVERPFTAVLDTDKVSTNASVFNVQLNWNEDVPPVSALSVWSEGIASSIMLLRSSKRKVELNYRGAAHTVRVAGDFTGWSSKGQDFAMQDGAWKRMLYLDPGQYQYQLVLDGKWMLDPSNADSIDNNAGGYNSLLTVADEEQDARPVLLTRSADLHIVRIQIQNLPDEVFVLWNNQRLPERMTLIQGNELSVAIPKVADQAEKSVLRAWVYNRAGISNDLYIPLRYGRPYATADQIPRSEWHSAQLYFMMVDRFVDGDSLNDAPIDDPEIDDRANYQGGDLAGIKKTLDRGYFRDLSMNMLWISPITQNPLIGYREYPKPHRKYSGYHGYWPVFTTRLDHRFGTDIELHGLIKDLHENNMNVILDFVSNHVHEDNPTIRLHPEWRTRLDLPDGTKNIRLWDEQRLTTWFDTFLPSLDHSIPEVADMLSDSALFWVKEFGFDGFRHDAVKHIPQSYWRTLTRKIKQQVVVDMGKPVFQIGETFGSRELIGSYIGSGLLDGKFDFNLYFDARNVFANDAEGFPRLETSLRSSLGYYGYHNLMGNITGNHDLPRFITYAGGSLSFAEDAKAAGWNRDIEVKDPVGYKKLEQLIAFMWTIPGIPVMYYGDEFGMPGAGDPDNRRMMRFQLTDKEQSTLQMTKKITAIRESHLALQFGDVHGLSSTDRTMIFRRRYFDDDVIVVFNKDSLPRTVPVLVAHDGWMQNLGSAFEYHDDSLLVTVPAYGVEILTRKQ